ncbi:hypothetical protein P4U05_17035 [Bacillus paranthracis]|nr:hypothetical protein [Bacillus paranthracis]ADY20339.1 hypothetical protein YBT020_05465 [Bacillus thuringiensis serovar finitimus YBT-020]MRC72833.1 hypothetical protein [Bacillus thuringiensis]OTX71283.1 hypothetical protein BK722_12785 [Bacillus thuringiensis serovar finitimus]PGZ45720.1 hypothetical protein COE56_25910 [Bacillus anthracis]MCR6799382.1 hypothetical protein [Bacillus paranthracis]
MKDQLEKLIEDLQLKRSLLMNEAFRALDVDDHENFGFHNGQRVFCEQMIEKLNQILEAEK